MQGSMVLRDAVAADMAAVTEIYAHHVRHGTASFEIEPPARAEMTARFEAVKTAGLPWKVAEHEGRILGYAYAAPYRPRPAYRTTVENSVYVAEGAGRKGLGRALLEAVIKDCRAAGRREMIAIIGDSRNAASIGLHARTGFRMVGVLRNVGHKHGRWLDSVIMQRSL